MIWRRRLIQAAASAALLATAACTEPAAPPPDPEAAAQVGEVEKLPNILPPPSETTPRFVGLWAASAEGCSDPAWRFEATRMSTQGEVACAFDNVVLTDAGYEIAATCTAEAPPAPYRINLSFAESARAMMVSGGPWAPIGLVYCAALPAR